MAPEDPITYRVQSWAREYPDGRVHQITERIVEEDRPGFARFTASIGHEETFQTATGPVQMRGQKTVPLDAETVEDAFAILPAVMDRVGRELRAQMRRKIAGPKLIVPNGR